MKPVLNTDAARGIIRWIVLAECLLAPSAMWAETEQQRQQQTQEETQQNEQAPSRQQTDDEAITQALAASEATSGLTSSAASPTEAPRAASVILAPEAISLELGEVKNLSVQGITRVAVGNPAVVDVSIVSSNEILIQAKAAGTTNVILWGSEGQRVWNVEVIDRTPEAIEAQLKQLLTELNLPGVRVQREKGKLFLVGEVPRKEDNDRLEQMLSGFQGVTNLVTVSAQPPPQPEQLPQLVKIAVQVVEIARSDLEKLGVNWTGSLEFIEQSATIGPAGEVKVNEGLVGPLGPFSKRVEQSFHIGRLFRKGVPFTINALVTQNRARLLAEPKLVTASGKQASSFVGVEVPVIKSTSVGAGVESVSVDFRETGVILKLTPNVHTEDPDRKITTVMEAEVSRIDKPSGLQIPVGTQTVLIPGFAVRKANTEVTTVPGETIVIAGLLEAEDNNNVSQIPGLGTMPVVGRLFRQPEVKGSRRELVIAVTPELMVDEGVEADHTLALEQALAVAEVTASVDDPRLRYALQVQDRIAKALRYPLQDKELSHEGTVKLRLHLFADGTLGRATVSKSSGIESLDSEALKAAESQSPFPGFPTQLIEHELWLEVPVIFRPS